MIHPIQMNHLKVEVLCVCWESCWYGMMSRCFTKLVGSEEWFFFLFCFALFMETGQFIIAKEGGIQKGRDGYKGFG